MDEPQDNFVPEETSVKQQQIITSDQTENADTVNNENLNLDLNGDLDIAFVEEKPQYICPKCLKEFPDEYQLGIHGIGCDVEQSTTIEILTSKAKSKKNVDQK